MTTNEYGEVVTHPQKELRCIMEQVLRDYDLLQVLDETLRVLNRETFIAEESNDNDTEYMNAMLTLDMQIAVLQGARNTMAQQGATLKQWRGVRI